ncbi:MAG: hypothetical protein ACK5A1_06925, partial [Planctomyces sp.]
QCVLDAEAALQAERVAGAERFGSWLSEVNLGELSLVSGEQARFGFDGAEGGHLSNAVRADQPAVLRGENRLVAGRVGEAVQFSGDDAVDLPVGNFQRHQPFSVSLWLKTPDVKSRLLTRNQ